MEEMCLAIEACLMACAHFSNASEMDSKIKVRRFFIGILSTGFTARFIVIGEDCQKRPKHGISLFGNYCQYVVG